MGYFSSSLLVIDEVRFRPLDRQEGSVPTAAKPRSPVGFPSQRPGLILEPVLPLAGEDHRVEEPSQRKTQQRLPRGPLLDIGGHTYTTTGAQIGGHDERQMFQMR